MMSEATASPVVRLSGRAPDAAVALAGVRIDNVTMAQAIGRIERMIRRGDASYVVTPNVDHLVKIQRDDTFRAAYGGASLVLADGMPLLWAARFLRTPIVEKVSGSDLFPRFCEVAAERGYKLFFLGGRPGAAARAAEVLTERNPGLLVVGMHCPPMGFENDAQENQKAIDMIRASGADALFVGLGSPKQERWMARHCNDLRVPVSIGIGASFDFVSGFVRRAPRFMQRIGLEWLWRLAREPKRMYRRYLIDDPRFFLLIWRQRAERKRALSRALRNAPDTVYTDIYTDPGLNDDVGAAAWEETLLSDEDVNVAAQAGPGAQESLQADSPAESEFDVR